VEYRILGPLEVIEDGQRVALAGAKQRALLAILLLHANETVSRDRLIDDLWGDEPPETAKTALQVHVSQVRKDLGSEAIVTRAPGYLVEVEEGQLDADRFEQLVDAARNKPASETAEDLREALALWRGPLLADLDDSVARAERARLEERRLAALEQRMEADLELGRHDDLVPELEGLAREHPLRERLRGQLMLALYRSGRQAVGIPHDDQVVLLAGQEGQRSGRVLVGSDANDAALHPEPLHCVQEPEIQQRDDVAPVGREPDVGNESDSDLPLVRCARSRRRKEGGCKQSGQHDDRGLWLHRSPTLATIASRRPPVAAVGY
jgi:DNA-binding SARP family transcriptional activator